MIEPKHLLPLVGGFSQRDYLHLLSTRVPPNVAEQVFCGSALNMIDGLDTQDLLAPLQRFSFPQDKPTEFNSYFDEVGMGLVFHTSEYDPYVAIYLCSLHLYLYRTYNRGNDMTPEVSAVIVDQCLVADVETRVHVLKFLLWLCDEFDTQGSRWSKHRPFYLLAVCMLWSSLLGCLADVTSECADEAPKRELSAERGILAHASYDITWRKLMEKVFGTDGNVVKSVSRCQQVFGRRGYKRGKTEGG